MKYYIIKASGIPSTSDVNAIWGGCYDNVLPIKNPDEFAHYALFYGTENKCLKFCAESEDDWENPDVKYDFKQLSELTEKEPFSEIKIIGIQIYQWNRGKK